MRWAGLLPRLFQQNVDEPGVRTEMNPKNRKPDDTAKGSAAGNAGGANGAANGLNGAANALAKAVSLHLEGKRKEALEERKKAAAHAGDTAEFCSAMGHIQFE